MSPLSLVTFKHTTLESLHLNLCTVLSICRLACRSEPFMAVLVRGVPLDRRVWFLGFFETLNRVQCHLDGIFPIFPDISHQKGADSLIGLVD